MVWDTLCMIFTRHDIAMQVFLKGKRGEKEEGGERGGGGKYRSFIQSFASA